MSVLDQTFPPQATRTRARARVPALTHAVLAWVVVVGGLAGLLWGYRATAASVSIRVDGLPVSISTHLTTVGDLLREVGVPLAPQDIVIPDLDQPLRSGMAIEVRRAHPVILEGDGRVRLLRTHAGTLAQALAEAGISVGPADELILEGQAAKPSSILPPVELVKRDQRTATPGSTFPWHTYAIPPLRAEVRRAIPLTLAADGPPVMIWSTATTVGEALAREGLTFFAEDLVQPGLDAPISAGLHIWIERSLPVTIVAGDHPLAIRSRQETVGELLAEQGLVLAGLDRISLPLDTPLTEGLAVHITRVDHSFEVHERITPYQTIWEPDPELEIDGSRLDQEGVNGITRSRYRLELEDGEVITRTLEDTWLAQEPITRVLKYGTKIVLREVDTPEGPLSYWRKVRMFATSYTAADAGVPEDASYYGRTRLGWKMRHGIVAVDPTVVKLGSQVYVPNYGLGDAADTGGLIQGRWIDLGYEVGQLRPWSRCVDVYLLAPAPPDYQINYRLPTWPGVPCLRQP